MPETLLKPTGIVVIRGHAARPISSSPRPVAQPATSEKLSRWSCAKWLIVHLYEVTPATYQHAAEDLFYCDILHLIARLAAGCEGRIAPFGDTTQTPQLCRDGADDCSTVFACASGCQLWLDWSWAVFRRCCRPVSLMMRQLDTPPLTR